MKTFALAAGLALAIVLTLATVASASISSLTLNSQASLTPDKTAVHVSGTVICTAGNDVAISLIVTQTSGKVASTGTGAASVTCSGLIQNWSGTVTLLTGTKFKNGPATGIFAGSDSTDGTSFPFATTSLHIGK